MTAYEVNSTVYAAAACIVFNPVFWNIAARLEYRTQAITRAAGSPLHGCYALAISIFSLGLLRDYVYHLALDTQPVAPALDNQLAKAAGAALFLSGNVLVLTSMWALGVTGTYLGDYFGILMDHIVTSFPFNVVANPMYVGSYLSFLGTALWYGKTVGLLLSVLVWAMYWIALRFEEPFTAEIYARRDRERAKKQL